jgi:hypothetical protein
MLRHITFSSGNMDISAQLAFDSAIKWGANCSTIYVPKDLDPDWVHAHYDILRHERGAGYWLWKPYIIDMELKWGADGDWLLYTDAGVEIIAPLKHLTDLGNDIIVFRNMYIHEQWCKMDTMHTITGWKSMPINQCQASAILLRVCDRSRDFVKEWLGWCEVPNLIDDSPSVLPNHSDFREHRHDQAILTCLAHKHNIKTWWWPAHYNYGAFVYDDGMNDRPYPVIFHHHRKRDNEWQ